MNPDALSTNAGSAFRRWTRVGVGPLAAVLLAAAAAGCGDSPPTSVSDAVVRDSAGVTIVENGSALDRGSVGWTVGPRPQVDIGVLEGDPAYQLFRVQDALRLADGRIAVVNSGSAEVRVFDAAGVHQGSWGGEGEGPGEFRTPSRISSWPGDSVAVWDGGLRRLTLFDGEGTFGRTVTFSGLEGIRSPRFQQVLPGGGIVVDGVEVGEDPFDGLLRMPIRVALVDGEGALLASLGEHPGREAYLRVGENMVSIFGLSFARGYVVAASPRGVIIGPNDHFELRTFDRTGGLTRIVRVDDPPRAVTEPVLRAEQARRIDEAPEQARAGLRASLTELPVPDSMPAFEAVLIDPLGYTWIRAYRPAAEGGAERWTVLDPDGVALGTVETPAGLEVYRIGTDFLLGRVEDDLDVEHVQLWPLERGG